MCKHMTGLVESACGFCLEANGILTGTAKVKSEKQSERAAEKEWERTLEQIARMSDVYGEPWTEEEVRILQEKMADISGYKEFRKTVREVSKITGRTLLSVKWHYKQLFIIPGKAHAGRVLLKIKAEIGGLVPEPVLA